MAAEPSQRPGHQGVRDLMPAPELVVGDSQPQVLELGDDLPTGSVDRERPVLYAVGDEDLGGAMGMFEIREAGREGDHVAKQIAFVTPSDSE